jgi:hypothetical protein
MSDQEKGPDRGPDNNLSDQGNDRPEWMRLVDESDETQQGDQAGVETPVQAEQQAAVEERQSRKPRKADAVTPEPPQPAPQQPDLAADDRVQVEAVKVSGGKTLVQWVDLYDADRLRRAELPSGDVELVGNGKALVTRAALDNAAPYGEDWESLITLTATVEGAARELRRNGIWTRDDLLNNSALARSALIAAHAGDLAELVRAVRDLMEREADQQ